MSSASWFRMTFLVENITDLEERPCFAPFLEHEDVLIVEGDMFARGDYERTWRVASFGLRTGELDFVLFVSSKCNAIALKFMISP